MSEEGDLERSVRELLAEYGLYGYHAPDSRRSPPGWPDWVILGRRVLWRELKSKYGDLSPAQRRVRDLIWAGGGDWAIWRPADLKAGRIEKQLAEVAW